MLKCDKILQILMNKKGILTMNTFYTSNLNNTLREQISDLVNLCKSYDNIRGGIFLEEELNAIKDFPCYIYCMEDTLLIGFLSVFIPDDDTCEIYAYVHPDHRKKHIFTRMYNKVMELLNSTSISYIQIVCEPGSPGEQLLLKMGYSDPLCECMMKYNSSYVPKAFSDFKLVPNDNNTYFQLSSNNIILGHCRIDYTKNCSTIYDVEIYEKHRGNGYSKVLINLILNHIKKSSIVLHVTASNTKALRAYTSCGFDIIEELHFYNISL